jgi:signal transduction histidine kinase/CheY-like chemotaxis protein
LNTDSTLIQLLQNGALRIGCDRSILAFIDYQHEYVVAEALRFQTPKMRKAKNHPELFVGQAKLPIDNKEGMCPETVRAFKDEIGEFEENGPVVFANRDRYMITDMRKDIRYVNKPCVNNFKGKSLRSFLGVPVISPLGWTLGTLMVGHSEERTFSDEDVEVLTDVSQAVVDHLELVKAKHDRARSTKLMKGLAEFMERESPVPHERTLSMSTRTSEKSYSEAPQSEAPESIAPDSNAGDEPVAEGEPESEGRQEREEENIAPDEVPASSSRPPARTARSASTVQTSHSEVFSPRMDDNTTPPSTPPEGNDQDPFDTVLTTQSDEVHEEPAEEQPAPPAPESTISEEVKRTFHRAAGIITEAMNTDGMMFIDAVPSTFGSRSNMNTPYEKNEDPFMSDTAESTSNEAEDVVLPKYLAKYVQPHIQKPEGHITDGTAPVPEDVLQRWIRRYPRGHIFTADEYGPIDCRYGPGASLLKQRRARRRSSRVMNDVTTLFEQFPHVRYVIFLPLWHFQRECWFAAAFGWVSFESAQAIDYSDLNLLTAFCNSVMAEVSRIEALSVSRAKSDFISSISHELRSPLHGILASSELLREGLEDPNLLSMLDMVDSCGTTLLDTFNNLLDYAKINNVSKALEDKDEDKDNHGRRIRKSETKTTDLSVLVQDVVEAVNLGHTSKTAFQNNQENQSVFTTMAELARAEEGFPDHSVIVTMNVEKRPSWMTKLDPGAWKRICMNIVGNALKYTRAGHIEVGLKLCDVPDERKRGVSRRNICFSVRDTGIGMSADYLKYQLFTPFAQENNLSPGTGLGLSIVNQIVKGLGGKMDVQSQIGIGTDVKVFVPLNPDTAGPLGQQMPPIDEVSQFDTEGKLQGRTLNVITPEAYKKLVNPDFEITHEIKDRFRAVRCALRNTAEDTLGMKVLYDLPDKSNEADIYFFDTYMISKAMHGQLKSTMHASILKFSPLVVLCSGAGPLNQLRNEAMKGKMIHLRHPLGPKKLASTFLSALKVGKIDLSEYTNPTGREFIPPPSKVEAKDESHEALKDLKAALSVPTRDLSQNGHSSHGSHSPRPEPTPIQDHQPVVPAHINSISSPAVLIGSTAKQTQHLLLVDDNAINIKILTTLVKKLNHTFETASNGLEAVQLYKASLIQNHQFDFVFMDISMPVMNGFEATREIRKFEKEEKVCCAARIAALTGLGSEVSRQEAFASGTNLFLTKPVKLGEIKKLLAHEQVRGEDAVEK